MIEDINALIKPVKSKGELANQKVTDPGLKLFGFYCSTYNQRHNILVKGEYFNEDDSRNALLVFFDLRTGKVKGGMNTPRTKTNLKDLDRHRTSKMSCRSTTSTSTTKLTSWDPV